MAKIKLVEYKVFYKEVLFMTAFWNKKKVNSEGHGFCIGKLLGGQGLRGSQGLLVK